MIRFLVYTNVFISICSAALATFCYVILFDLFPGLDLIGFVFFATLFAYNFHRRVGNSAVIRSQKTLRELWLEEKKNLISFLIVLSFCGASYFFYQLPKEALILVFPLGLLSVFYVLELSRIPSLRSLPFLKIFVISFVWGGVTVLLPLITAHSLNTAFHWPSQLFALAMSLFVFGETIPFDIRDMQEDKKEGLKTLPIKIGIQKSKVLSYLLYLISFGLMMILSWYSHWDTIYILCYGFSILYSIVMIKLLKVDSHDFHYSLGIESTLCMPLILYLFFRVFLS